MKGDFSRLTFDKTKHYAAVLKQQGRVDLDADWNELQAIQRYRMETGTADVIGCCGAPRRAAGFHIVTSLSNLYDYEINLLGNKGGDLPNPIPSGDFVISAGRIYVDGVLCENENAILFTKQPDLPGAAIPDNASQAIVYLDVWQRHLTVLDDDSIREKALGGSDTATRLKTIWQVKVLPFSIPTFNPPMFVKQINSLANAFKTIASYLAPEVKQQLSNIRKSTTKLMKARAATAAWNPTVLDARNLLDAVAKLDLPSEVEPVISEIINPIRVQLPSNEPISCKNPPPEWSQLVVPSNGQLAAQTRPTPPNDDPCTIPPGAGYRGLENQLYRVEIHQGNVDPNGVKTNVTPTFKWSRDNSSVVTAITGDINGNTIPVHDLGPDNVLGFAIGQWVEVLDDTCELNGQLGDLVQITDVKPDSKQIIVKGTVNLTFQSKYHPKLRRWDSMGDIKVDGTWQPLEAGIEVQFSKQEDGGYGTFKTGDYWLIPARTATADIEWPRELDANGNPDPKNPLPQRPRGIKHHYCRLALINISVAYNDGAPTIQINIKEDCRCRFPSLCNSKPVVQAESVIQIQSVTLAGNVQFKSQPSQPPIAPINIFAKGIVITCTPGVTLEQNNYFLGSSNSSTQVVRPQPACFVTLQLPCSFRDNVLVLSAQNIAGYQPLILDATVNIHGNVITWQLVTLKTILPLFQQVDGRPILACLTLKGNYIWGNSAAGGPQMYLDGESFGDPAGANNTGLILPSGDGRRGGDFEMWFWLQPLE